MSGLEYVAFWYCLVFGTVILVIAVAADSWNRNNKR